MSNAQIVIMLITALIIFSLIGITIVAELDNIREAINELKERIKDE